MISIFLQLHPQNCLLVLFQTQTTQEFRSLETQTPFFSTTFQHHTSNVFLFFLTQTLPFHELPTGFQHGVSLGIGQPYMFQTQKMWETHRFQTKKCGKPIHSHVKMWETHPFHLHLLFQHVRTRGVVRQFDATV